MKKISIRIADLLLRKHHIEESMYNIYQYGLQMTLEIGCSFITSIIVFVSSCAVKQTEHRRGDGRD